MTEVIDTRNGPDLPSIMTLTEFRQMMVFIEHYAAPFPNDEIEIGVLVRDRGRNEPRMMASWIEFSVAGREYAFWRATMDLYEVKDGKVEGDPIHRND